MYPVKRPLKKYCENCGEEIEGKLCWVNTKKVCKKCHYYGRCLNKKNMRGKIEK
jgi:ribosome-binding protein aMBF1 (putative translation factor)